MKKGSIEKRSERSCSRLDCPHQVSAPRASGRSWTAPSPKAGAETSQARQRPWGSAAPPPPAPQASRRPAASSARRPWVSRVSMCVCVCVSGSDSARSVSPLPHWVIFILQLRQTNAGYTDTTNGRLTWQGQLLCWCLSNLKNLFCQPFFIFWPATASYGK